MQKDVHSPKRDTSGAYQSSVCSSQGRLMTQGLISRTPVLSEPNLSNPIIGGYGVYVCAKR